MKTFAVIAAAFALFIWLGVPTDTAPVVRMISPQHDGHLWLCHPSGAWQPIHHPDCPCRDAIAP
jgi:hypothetical protein